MLCPTWLSLLTNRLVTVKDITFRISLTWINAYRTNPLTDCAQMEDQLSALGERWSHVCRWADQRASALQQLANHWEQVDTDLNRLKAWLAAHEHSLRLIETNPSADRTQMIDVARQLQVTPSKAFNCLNVFEYVSIFLIAFSCWRETWSLIFNA